MEIYADRHSQIYKILTRSWENYRLDYAPVDRRMKILEEQGIFGLNSENIRFLINELVRLYASGGVYLEVGVYQGGSLLSAALFNARTRCIGIDDFLEYSHSKRDERIFKKNLKKFGNPKNIEFYGIDYRQAIRYIFLREPDLKVNVYFYDGMHTPGDQAQALKLILPHLAKRCIILVDDINWDFVERANDLFVRRSQLFKTVFKIKTNDDSSRDWWNGLQVISAGI